MRISATCRSKSPGLTAGAGFTLIEIVVVLAIMAGVGALAMANLTRLYQSVNERATLDELRVAIRSASVHAYATGQQLTLHEYLGQQVGLPEGWHFGADQPIVITANGMCRGGRLFVATPRRSLELQLAPPFCEPQM